MQVAGQRALGLVAGPRMRALPLPTREGRGRWLHWRRQVLASAAVLGPATVLPGWQVDGSLGSLLARRLSSSSWRMPSCAWRCSG